MPREGFAPEIKQALGTGKPGRVNTTPGKKPPSKLPSAKAPPAPDAEPEAMPQSMQRNEAPRAPVAAHAPDAHHVAAATSIAHAILSNRGGRPM